MAMLNLIAMVLTIAGIGTLAAGSAICVPAFIGAGFFWWKADDYSFDVEVLGGVMILIMIAGVAYALVLRPIFNFIFG